MKTLIEDWRRLSVTKQVIAAAAAIAIMFAVSFLIRIATTPRLTLLYAGLDSSSSGEVLEALDSLDVKYDVRGDAVYVPEDKRDRIRMELARDGLPQQGQAGFELLENLNGFATTSDMFDAAYWRAKEGELARTILSTPGLKSARVHIAVPKRSAFARTNSSASAVVTVSMARGRLSVEHANGMRFLVALAVPDLSPEHVAIIDSARGVILPPGEKDSFALGSENVSDREQAIENDLLSLVEARVGVGNARVNVAIEVTHEQETYFERILDPQQRVMTNRDSTEKQESGNDGAGVVTVASNLPEGDSSATTSPGKSQRSETNESTRFDVSERRRERVAPAGALKRMQVAVLINEPKTDGSVEGTRTAEELQSIKNLVAAAAGYDESRGDVVTIESLPFDVPEIAGEEIIKNGPLDFLAENIMSILQLVIPALVTIILALFVLKPILTSDRKSGAEPALHVLIPDTAPIPVLAAGPTAASPVDDLKRIATEKHDASAVVLKNWLDQSGELA